MDSHKKLGEEVGAADRIQEGVSAFFSKLIRRCFNFKQ